MRRTKYQLLFEKFGASQIVIKLIGHSALLPRDLLLETLVFACGMLKGGNRTVQEKISRYLLDSKLDEAFFAGVRLLFRRSIDSMNLIQQMSPQGMPSGGRIRTLSHRMSSSSMSVRFRANSRPSTRESQMQEVAEQRSRNQSEAFDGELMIHLVELLRLMCEDHFLVIQNYFREQSDNLRSYNLMDEVAAFLQGLQWVKNPHTNIPVWNISPSKFNLVYTLLTCLVEFAQGNEGNQRSLARPQLIYCLNDLLDYQRFEREVTERTLSKSIRLRPHRIESNKRITVDSSSHTIRSVVDDDEGVEEQVNSGGRSWDEIQEQSLLLIFSLVEGQHDREVHRTILTTCNFKLLHDYIHRQEKEYQQDLVRLQRRGVHYGGDFSNSVGLGLPIYKPRQPGQAHP